MLRRVLAALILSLAFFTGMEQANSAQGPDAVYRERRQKLLQALGDSAVALLRAADTKVRSQDVNYEYRQDSNFYYLTGAPEPGCILLLVPAGVEVDGRTTREVFLVPTKTKEKSLWTSPPPTVEDQRTRFDAVVTLDQLQGLLGKALPGKVALYVRSPLEFVYEPISDQRYYLARDMKKALQEKYPHLKVKTTIPALAAMREVKSPEELRLMQRAIDITCDALAEAMRSAEPGMYEYQLEAIIEFIFKHAGAEAEAFPCIIGSGPNALILHYEANRRQMHKGELVVMDVGAEYQGYAADITRTIPVSGKFTDAQRRIYETVLQAQREAIAMIKPGVKLSAIQAKAKSVIEAAGYGKYLPHGTTHSVGLDVHDVMASDTLKPGMVITVEPGIYIPDKAEGIDPAYWNTGVRIEDDVLVTETGHRVLSETVPREVSKIESLMREKSRIGWIR